MGWTHLPASSGNSIISYAWLTVRLNLYPTTRPKENFLPVTRGSARKLFPPKTKNDTAAKSASLSSLRACVFFQWPVSLSLSLSVSDLEGPAASQSFNVVEMCVLQNSTEGWTKIYPQCQYSISMLWWLCGNVLIWSDEARDSTSIVNENHQRH